MRSGLILSSCLMPCMCKSSCIKFCGFVYYGEKKGPIRESNPGPLAPKARIMPLDQQATMDNNTLFLLLKVAKVKYQFKHVL